MFVYNVVFISTVQQTESVTYPLFFGFPFCLGHHRATSRVPVLYSRVSLVVCLIHGGVHRSVPISQFIPPPPSPHGVHMFVLCVCLYVCFANKIIYTTFLDSTYVHYCTFVFFFLIYFTLYMTVFRSSHVSTNFQQTTALVKLLELKYIDNFGMFLFKKI